MTWVSEERLDELLHAGVTGSASAGGREADQIGRGLAHLRSAATTHAEGAWESAGVAHKKPRTRGIAGALLGAAVAITLAAGYPLLHYRMNDRHAPAGRRSRTLLPEVSDEALLRGIDRDLSATIPLALEPLAVRAVTPKPRMNSARKD